MLPLPLVWVYEYWSNGTCLYVGKTHSLRARYQYAAAHPETAAGQAFNQRQYVVLNMAIDPELAKIKELRPTLNERHNGVSHPVAPR